MYNPMVKSYEIYNSGHVCYVLKSSVNNKLYIGYTIDFNRRIRQHNGELVGGAKATKKFRPWYPLCIISGFLESSSALRFEYRLQRSSQRNIVEAIRQLIISKDGSIAKDNKISWPTLLISWYSNNRNYYYVDLPRVINWHNDI